MFMLTPTIEDRATGFFVANYVLGLSGPSRGHLDYLADIARREVLDEGLLCSIKAVGLAGYSHSAHAPSLMKNARYQYMKAIQSTNRALRDPEGAKKDSTLMSIMILTIFEAITGCGRQSIEDWAQHVLGSSAVVKLRGPEQLRTVAGRKMMMQTTASLLTYCLHRACRVPDHIEEFMTSIANNTQHQEPTFIVSNTMMKMAALRADVKNLVITNPHEILAQALELDGILMNLETDTRTEDWRYHTVFTDEVCEFVWNGQYHVYYDYWIAQIWNALRVVRVFAHEMIREVLVQGFAAKPPIFSQSEHTAQFQVSTDILYKLQADIMHSVVQHVGYFPEPTEKLQHKAITANKSIYLREELADVRMSGGSFLLWPLFLVGMMDLADEPVRQFAIKNLTSIGDRMGIGQAYVLAELIRAEPAFQPPGPSNLGI